MATAAKEEKVNTNEIAKFSKSQDPTNSKKDDSKANASPTDSGTAPPYRSLLEGNGFKVVKKIGSGSYSKVKLAFSEQHKSMVAIKVVSKYHVPEEFLRKFLYNEIKVVKFLKHENIIQYYQSIESSQRLYVVMQYAENGSILDLIHRERRLSESRAAHFFRQILAAVDYCHSQGICHRDIKCENILLDKKEIVKLIDFGFAKLYRPKEGKVLENAAPIKLKVSKGLLRKREKDPLLSETYCGSYAYASPEILRGIPYHPMYSDVWATGCVLYAMVHGRLPFDDRDPSKLIKQVQSPVTFPTTVVTTEEFKDCIRHIFAPLKSRYTISKLIDDFWVKNAHQLVAPTASDTRRLSTR